MPAGELNPKQCEDAWRRLQVHARLREDTPYKNMDEYFHAVLVMHGPPPFHPELRHTYDTANVVSGRPEFIEWRQRVAVTLNETLHCSIDPSFMMQEYFRWLNRR